MKARLWLVMPVIAVSLSVAGFVAAAQAAGGSGAAGHGVSTATGSAPVLDSVHPAAAATAPCFTSFSSNHPGGGPLTITYRNCSSRSVLVCPIYVGNPSSFNSGSNFAYCAYSSASGLSDAVELNAGASATWTFTATFTTGDYSMAAFTYGPVPASA